jgi:hypothetical protein
LLPIAEILFLSRCVSPQRTPLRNVSANDVPNRFHRENSQSHFASRRAINRARSLGGGEHEFTAIVMRACGSCRRDEIETVYRLRVVIETPRIELADFRCNAGLVDICVPDAAQAGHIDCGFRLSQSMAVGYCSIRVNPDDPTWLSDLPTSLTSLYSLVRSLSCRKELCTPRLVSCRGREPNAVTNHLDDACIWVWC